MKKIFNVFMVAALGALTLQSCDPLDDTYADLDKSGVDQSLVVDLEYEMVEADYTSLKGNTAANKSFSSDDSAKVLIPEFLNTKFRYEEETSSVNVTYLVNGVNTVLQPTFVHTLTTADYIAVNGASTGNPNVPRFTNLNSAASIIKAAEATNKTPLNGAVSKLTFEWNSRPVKDSTVTVIYFDGVWSISETLVAADYTLMGQSNPNFSSVATANSLISIYLANKYPYAITENAILPVVYQLWNSSTRITTTEVTVMKYSNGKWIETNGVVKMSSKFVVKDGKWVADNTIKYTLITNDYKVTIANLAATELPDASANIIRYGNFDMRYWNVDQINKYLGLFADAQFPTAVVGQVCQLTYVTYSPSATIVKSFVKKDNGKFEVQ
jgi:hypothetical protein